jgi:hypothetical protein
MTAHPAYTGLDRLLHRVALDRRFHGHALQKSLAELEQGFLGEDAPAAAPDAPVFVTALPRAGTTLLLDLLARVPAFASHTYRDMPFVLAPVLWGRLSSPFRKAAGASERAHGDGVMVGYDSPEAFEEVLWLAFWPDKYRADRILPWTAGDRAAGFEAFFARHMRSVIAARARERAGSPPARYLSTNNANIARLPLLPVLFPDCRVVVPLREPLVHCRSLLRQHRRFLELHARDPFARQYMDWIGHFEFGAGLRPIRFGDDGEELAGDPRELDFWLRYWISAHRTILSAGDSVILFDYAGLCADPARSLGALADSLAIADADALVAGAEQIRRPAAEDRPADKGDPALRRHAAGLYEAALARCVNRVAA